jgi:SAM-dependent methyltransferase
MYKGLSDKDLNMVSDFYDERFQEKGDSIESVGWRDKETQELRFKVLLRNLNPKSKTILDFGCGLSDFIPYLENIIGNDFKYIGIDISSELIEQSKLKYPSERFTFLHGDIFNLDIPEYDIGISSGALSYKISNNEEYANEVIKHLFLKAKESCSLNFLTSYVDFKLEKNHHYCPINLFKYSKTISKYVNLIHDYPLYEFTLQLHKTGKNI